MHLFAEAELLTVEGDRGIDVVDDVADAHGGHRCPPRILSFWSQQHPLQRQRLLLPDDD
jgi:hypothetical protein